jgi:hypothetical protein
LALAPGETSETFFREVDENLRRDQAGDFLKRYGAWLIGAAVLVLAITGGLIYWRGHQVEVAATNSEKMNAAMGDIGAGKLDAATPVLTDITNNGNDAGRASALLTQAAVAVQKGDRKAAAAFYAQVANDSGLPDAWRNTGLVRGTAIAFDDLKPEDVVNRLQPLAVPGNPWFGSAGELTGMAMIKQNRRAEAGRLFASIAADKSVPESLRSRAEQIAGTLGAAPAAPVSVKP